MSTVAFILFCIAMSQMWLASSRYVEEYKLLVGVVWLLTAIAFSLFNLLN